MQREVYLLHQFYISFGMIHLTLLQQESEGQHIEMG